MRTLQVLVIVGPTGSGKSDLALTLAQECDGEIIAADSRTVYRGMDVGTAKPTRDVSPLPTLPQRYCVRGVPHHLIDIRNPDQSYSVAEFRADAELCIAEIVARGKLPIVVGGTMLYVKALVDQLEWPNIPEDPLLRHDLRQKSNDELMQMLVERDPEVAAIIDRHNPRRLIRALEVILKTGKPITVQRGVGESPYSFLEIGLAVPREELYRRIDARTQRILGIGLIEEVRHLFEQYGSATESLRGLIYRQVIEWLTETNGELQELVVHLNAAQHRYARAQERWFRKDSRVRWVSSTDEARRCVDTWRKR